MSMKSAIFAAGLAVASLAGTSLGAAADALVTQGIGTSNCAQLANDLKPADGLANPVNLMLFSWVQGYASAVNLALLEDTAKHVDLGDLDEGKVLNLVLGFCKANPDKRPVNAVDDLIRKSNKLSAKWEHGTVDWRK
jgi:hypothetical protein